MTVIQKAIRKWNSEGTIGLVRALRRRIFASKPRVSRLRCFPTLWRLFEGKKGLEIGGPTLHFAKSGQFPVYPIAGSIDNCNFGCQTIWEGEIREGATFRFDQKRPAGNQYILEATALTAIPSASYDFVLSSHMLEHTANPLRALSEWVRVLKLQGILLLVVPHKEGTFDHRRPITTMQHLIEDLERETSEADMTHLAETLSLHDLARSPSAGDFQQFKLRSEKNLENRCLHHHVFDTRLVIELVDHMRLQILGVEAVLPSDIFLVAQKLASDQEPQNVRFLATDAEYRQLSPFMRDRLFPNTQPTAS